MTNKPIYSLPQSKTHFFINLDEFNNYYTLSAKKIASRSIKNTTGLIKRWDWEDIHIKLGRKFNKPVIIFNREPKERFIASIAEIFNPFEGYNEANVAKLVFANTVGKDARDNLEEYYLFCLKNFFTSALRDVHLSHYNTNILRTFLNYKYEKGYNVVDINSSEFKNYVGHNIKTDSTGPLKQIVREIYEKIKNDDYFISHLYIIGFVNPERESYKILLNSINETTV
mgnify:FL=1|tara:strand:+ start:4809 stop:5489 length:681 start_codon:yes stop_codon:yes gene_type:complete